MDILDDPKHSKVNSNTILKGLKALDIVGNLTLPNLILGKLRINTFAFSVHNIYFSSFSSVMFTAHDEKTNI